MYLPFSVRVQTVLIKLGSCVYILMANEVYIVTFTFYFQTFVNILSFIGEPKLQSGNPETTRSTSLKAPVSRLFPILLFVPNSSTTWRPIVGLDCRSLPCGIFCAYLVGYFVGIGCSTYHPGNESPLWNLIIITIINIIIVIIIIIIIIIIITIITITTIINFFNVNNQNMQIMCIVKNSHL